MTETVITTLSEKELRRIIQEETRTVVSQLAKSILAEFRAELRASKAQRPRSEVASPPPMVDGKTLMYSVDTASKLTTLSKSHLRNEIRDGRLPILRLGRRVMIPADSLNNYLQGN
jgi:excisionase family DNA binding protein